MNVTETATVVPLAVMTSPVSLMSSPLVASLVQLHERFPAVNPSSLAVASKLLKLDCAWNENAVAS